MPKPEIEAMKKVLSQIGELCRSFDGESLKGLQSSDKSMGDAQLESNLGEEGLLKEAEEGEEELGGRSDDRAKLLALKKNGV